MIQELVCGFNGDALFAAEISVDRHLCQTAAQRDIIDRGLVDPFVQKAIYRGLQNQCAILLSLFIPLYVWPPFKIC